ncbi:MAG: hypothetical protein KC466_01155 [Myxococcales bacterium]|nr:hypothetical protein [Myxococcales bacterium]
MSFVRRHGHYGSAAGAMLCLLAAACSNGGGHPTARDATPALAPCDPASAPVRTLWDRLNPTSPMPIPSDYFTTPDPTTATGLRLNLTVGGNIPADYIVARDFPDVIDELNTLPGWGTAAHALIGFTGALDFAASGGTRELSTQNYAVDRYVFEGPRAPIAYVNIDRRSDAYGERASVIAYQIEGDLLVVEPVRPLDAETRYALVITKELFAPNGGAGDGCVLPSSSYQRLLDAPGDLTAEERDLRAFVRAAIDDLRAVDPLYAARNLVLAMPLTTQPIARDLVDARDFLLSLPEPEVVPGSMTVEAPASGGWAARVRGKFRTPDFGGPERVWARDAVGDLRPKRDLELDFLLQIPLEEPGVTAQPVPLTTALHGFSIDTSMFVPMGELFADLGVAMIGVNAVGHRNGNPVVNIVDFFNLLDIITASGNPFAPIRDAFRQSAIDQFQALRLAERLAREGLDVAEPIGVPDIALSKPEGLLGFSMGGVMGSTLAAITPELTWNALLAGGGAYSRIVANAPFFAGLIENILATRTARENVTPEIVALTETIIQTVLDPGDSVNFARRLVREPLAEVPGAGPRDVFLFQAIGDEIVANASTEALMRAMEIPLVAPEVAPITGIQILASPLEDNVAPGLTAGYFQFKNYHDPITGNVLPASHVTIFTGVEPLAQLTTFVRSFYAGLPLGAGPKIVDPFDPEQIAERP